MVDAVLQAVAGDVPVTVKMRRGSDDSPAAEARFWTILEGAIARGIAAATVHPRTVAQKYAGPSRWPFLSKVKAHVGTFPILGSGDLFSAFDVLAMLRETNVDGVTVARGCIGNPFVFTQIRELLAGRPALRPTAAMVREALARPLATGGAALRGCAARAAARAPARDQVRAVPPRAGVGAGAAGDDARSGCVATAGRRGVRRPFRRRASARDDRGGYRGAGVAELQRVGFGA